MTKNKSNKTVLVIGIVALLGCVCLLVVGLVGYGFFAFNRSFPITKPIEAPFIGITPDTTPVVTRPPIESISGETLKLLETSIVPPNEPKELACHLEGKCNIPDVVATFAAPRVVGDIDKFWVTNVETNENTHVQATLRYITPHVYFWVQDGVPYDENEMRHWLTSSRTRFIPSTVSFLEANGHPVLTEMNIFIFFTPEGLVSPSQDTSHLQMRFIHWRMNIPMRMRCSYSTQIIHSLVKNSRMACSRMNSSI